MPNKKIQLDLMPTEKQQVFITSTLPCNINCMTS